MARRPEFYYDKNTGYYRKRIKLPTGKWKDVRGKTKEELRAKLYDLENSIRQGVVLDDDTTVAELALEWYNNRKNGLSIARQNDYRNAINLRICPELGQLKLKAVKPEHCQRVMAGMANLSQSTQQKTVSAMKQIFECAVDNGLIQRSPAEKIKAKGAKSKEKIPLTIEQCAQLEAAVRGTRAYILVMLGLYSGLRKEEILALQWSDVDLDAAPPRLTVNSALQLSGGRAKLSHILKSDAAHRTIPLPPNLAAALRAEKAASSSQFVISGKTGGHVTWQGARNLTQIIDRRAPMSEAELARRKKREEQLGRPIMARTTQKNIKKIDFRPTPHQLRHTYITRLIEGGLDVKKVQYLAGHKTIQMTLNVYSHVMHNRPEELIGPITAALPGQSPGQNSDDGALNP